MPLLRRVPLLIGLLAALGAVPLPAADNAFLIQGPVQVEESVQMAHNCFANKGMTPARFRLLSDELKREYLKDTTPAAARKVSFRYLGSCPGGFKGSCEGIFGEKASLHYMADDYLMKGGMAKLFCEASDGRWR